MRNLTIHKNLWFVGILTSFTALSGCVSAPVVFGAAGGTVVANSAGSSVSVPQQATDLTIRSNIYTILNNMPGINGANVEVTVFNGIVLLLGQVGSEDLMQKIVSQTSALDGVLVVYNQMTVGPNEPLSRYTSDSWITSKVIASMAKKINPTHFKVVTQDGVVYILGQVTHDEANIAVEQAQQVSGVKSIVKIFNYVSPTKAQPEVVSVDPNAKAPPEASNPQAAASTASASSSSGNDGIPQYAPSYGADGASANSGATAVGSAASD